MNAESLTLFKQTIQYHAQDIFVKPVCDFFNLDYQNQVEKIRIDLILKNCYGKNRNNSLFGDNYPRVTLTKKGFIRWIQLINPNTIAENVRDKFIEYQTMIFDYLFGSMEENETLRLEYARNKKLKSLFSKIGREIQLSDRKIREFMDGRYLQQSITFKPAIKE